MSDIQSLKTLANENFPNQREGVRKWDDVKRWTTPETTLLKIGD
jgi:hypothetical protein